MSLSRYNQPVFEYYGKASIQSYSDKIARNTNDGKVWYMDTSGNLRRIDLITLSQDAIKNIYSTSGTTGYFSFITAASGVTVFTGTGVSYPTINFVEKSTLYSTSKVNMASEYSALSLGNSKCIAADVSRGVVLYSSNSSGYILRVNSDQTTVSYTPTSLVGTTVTSIEYRYSDDTNSYFLVGTANGKVFEMTHNGIELSTITLPQPINRGVYGSYPKAAVQDIVCNYSTGTVLVITTSFEMLLYDWSTKTLLDKSHSTTSGITDSGVTYSVVSDNVCGQCVYIDADTSKGSAIPVFTLDFAASSIFYTSSYDYYIATASNSFPKFIGYDVPNDRVFWTTNGPELLVLSVKTPEFFQDTYIDTRAQEPIGINVNHTITRFKRGQFICSSLDTHTVVSEGSQNYTAKKRQEYIEESHIDNKYDIRSVST